MIKERIKKIVDYLKDMEATHFEESDKPKDHTYMDVLAVEKWLYSPSVKHKITCSCGQELKLTLQEPLPGQEGDRFVSFCHNPNCRTKWLLEDVTSEYEEMVMNEIIDPENGEYKDKDDIWCYADGSCME